MEASHALAQSMAAAILAARFITKKTIKIEDERRE
jgi:hypothetical protein